MADISESSINKEWDLSFVYDMSKQALSSRDWDQALKLSEKGLNESRKTGETGWITRFDNLHSDIKYAQLERKSEANLKRAYQEAEIFKYDKAVDFLEKAKKNLNAMYRLGRNEAKIKKLIKRINKKITDVNKNKAQEDLKKKISNSEPEAENSSDDIPNETISQEIIDNPEQMEAPKKAPTLEKPIIPKGPPKRMTKKPMKKKENYQLELDANTSISVDGSNVAWMGGDKSKGDMAKVGLLIELKQTLLDMGFEKITIFCDHSLPWQIDDKQTLENLFVSKEVIRVDKGEEADPWVLDNAREDDGYFIVESEKYEDWHEIYTEDWINERRIKCKYINGKFLFRPAITVKPSPIQDKKQESKERIEELPNTPLENSAKPDINSRIKSFLDSEEDINDDKLEKIVAEAPRTSMAEERNRLLREKLTKEELVDFHAKIQEQLEQSETLTIPQKYITNKSLDSIDFLTVKILQINESLELIIIHPIKLCNLKGRIITADLSVDYNPDQKGKLPSLSKGLLLAESIGPLKQSSDVILDDITEQKDLYQFFKKYLRINIQIERSMSKKELFFHSGPIQYKILIEPILVCKEKTGCIEKMVEFPYYRDQNIHAVQYSQLMDVISYLKEKHINLEDYTEKENSMTMYFDALDKCTNSINILSIPFLGYGILFMMLLIFQVYSVIPLLLGLGYGAIGLYSVILLFIIFQFSKKKAEIQQEFNVPYYKRPIHLDSADLLLISEVMTPEWMEQLTYECLGKNHEGEYKLSNKAKATRQLRQNESEMLIEDTPVLHSKGNDDSIFSKYSSFLED